MVRRLPIPTRKQSGLLIRRLRSFLLDLVFPPRCAGCQRSGQSFCDFCAQNVSPAPPQLLCRGCGWQLSTAMAVRGEPCANCATPLAMIRAATLHVPPLAPAIHAFKYQARVELAPGLARYLRAAAMEEPWPTIMARLDGIVPVPLHEERLRVRGYNQAGLLARYFAYETSIPVLDGAIRRVRETPTQVGLHARERVENVRDAFEAAPGHVRGNALLLVDDVFTTGSTMRECAGALREAGASAVFGLVLSQPAALEREQSSDENSLRL